MRVYGSCIEPGGMELDNNVEKIECENCHKEAFWKDWETVDGGSINAHWQWWCENCGASDQSLWA